MPAGRLYYTTPAGVPHQGEDPVGHMLILFDPWLWVLAAGLPVVAGFTIGEVLDEVRPIVAARDPNDSLRFMLEHFSLIFNICIMAGYIEAS
jgi:hypothetical protein